MKSKFYFFIFFFLPFLLQSQISLRDLLNERNDLPDIYAADQVRGGAHIAKRSFSDELKNEFQAILDEEYANSGAAGLSSAVIIGDDLWTGVAGNSSSSDTMSSEMVLGVGSLSKSIAAATILKLEEEGKLSIDDKISKWLDNREFVDSSITIKQLLNHTSGVYNVTDNPKFGQMINSDFEKIWKPEEVLDTFLLEPYFAPGNGWHYSNSNYILLGMIVEKVTGKKYHEVVREKILHPYGLDSMYLKPFESNSLAVGHLWADPSGGTNGIDLSGLGIEFKALFSGAWAAGAYMARTKDICKWMKLLGSGNVLSDFSQKEMLSGVSKGDNIYYGLGVVYVTDDADDIIVVGHDGNIGYTTKAYHFLNENFTFAIQCNDITVNNHTLDNVFNRFISAYKSFTNSLDFVERDHLMSICPNPVSGFVNIKFNNLAGVTEKIIIFNEFGQKMYSGLVNAKEDNVVDVSTFPRGVYVVKSGGSIAKFVVQ